MAKRKTEQASETVEINGVSVPENALDNIPAGSTFTVLPSDQVATELSNQAEDSQQSEGAVNTATATAAEPEKPTPAPNLIWSSEKSYKLSSKDGKFDVVNWVDKKTDEDKEGKLKYGEPPEFVQIGARKITLPDAATQKKGFYHQEAKLLRRVVSGLKEFKPKG